MPKRAAALAVAQARARRRARHDRERADRHRSKSLCDGDAYRVRAGDWVRLEGQAMPDRACCTMPSNVWYKPMVAIEGRLVGESALFAVDDPELGPPFERRAENDAFLGSLAVSAPACATKRSSRPLCCGDEPILDAETP
jgi:hypothetical protein